MQRKCNLSRLCFVLLLFANSINCLLKWDQNYCRTNKKHILCDQRDSTNIGISSSCKNITEVELTDNDKINFLTDVNKFRREIGQVGSPVQDTFPSSERKKSAVLMELEWSGELQKAARKVAEFLCEEIPTEPRLMEFEVTDGEGTFAYQSNYIQFIRYEISFKKEQFLEYQGGVRAFPFDTLQSYNNSLSDDVLAVLTYSKSKYIGCVGIKDWKGKEDTAYAVSEVCLLLPSVVPEHSDPFKPGEFCSNCSGGFNKCDSRTGMTFCIEVGSMNGARDRRQAETNSEVTAGSNPEPSKKAGKPSATNIPFTPSTDCKSVSEHILCTQNAAIAEIPSKCVGANSIIISEPEKNDLLSIFNNLRRAVANGTNITWKQEISEIEGYKDKTLYGTVMTVADMVELVWHPDLEKAAENYHQLCIESALTPSALLLNNKNGKFQAKMIKFQHNGDSMEANLRKLFVEAGNRFIIQNININNYSASEDYDLFTVLTYSRARFIGCARRNYTTIPDADTVGMATVDVCMVAFAESEDNNILFYQGSTASLCKQNSKDYSGLCSGMAKVPLPPEYRVEDIFRQDDHCPDHILCDSFYETFKEENKNKLSCGKTNIKLTIDERKVLLKNFNKVRHVLAGGSAESGDFPSAADMMELEWDYDLQEEAERFLQACAPQPLEHNMMAFGKDKDVFIADIYPTYKGVGETTLYTNLVDKLTVEAKSFSMKDIESFTFRENYNLFTVAYFARARYIGCARVNQPWWQKSKESEDAKIGDACFFMPFREKRQLNQASKTKLYLRGKQCSRCPYGSECSTEPDHTSLCKAFPKKLGGLDRNDNYCNLHYKHVLCPTWFDPGNVSLCEGKKNVTLKNMDKQKILNTYNGVRSNIAFGKSDIPVLSNLPTAADMYMLEWDSELERAAQNLLGKCSLKDQPPEILRFGKDGEFQAVKIELVYNGTDMNSALKELLADEAKMINETIAQQYPNEDWFKTFSNLTASNPKYQALKAMVSAESRYIGCAELEPPFKNPLGKSGERLQTCLIAAVHNDSRDSLYSAGDPCTQCRPGFICEDGMCKPDRIGMERPDNFCALSSKHILCLDWDLSVPDRCAQKSKIFLEPEVREDILMGYNNFREGIATGTGKLGPASNMLGIEWDAELQEAAERILYNCQPKNTLEGSADSNPLLFGQLGQLQAMAVYIQHNGDNFEEVLNNTIKEAADKFTGDPHDYRPNPHDYFTGLAFADARHMGCARITPSDTPDTTIEEVCVLGATEKPNINNNLFIGGDPCSQCPVGFVCHSNLCWNPNTKVIPTTVATTLPPPTTTTTSTSTSTSTSTTTTTIAEIRLPEQQPAIDIGDDTELDDYSAEESQGKKVAEDVGADAEMSGSSFIEGIQSLVISSIASLFIASY